MDSNSKKQNREKITVGKMINLYCKKHHGNQRCAECEALYDYASQKIHLCTFGENKPVCAQCEIHCYKPEMRTQIRKVMRYSGSRMFIKHPLLTFYHLIASRRK